MTGPARAIPPPEPSAWQTAYRRCREIEREVTDNPSARLTRALLRGAISSGRRALEQDLAAFRRTGGESRHAVPSSLVAELRSLADLRSSYHPTSDDFVFDDVYHLAFDRFSCWRSPSDPVPPAEKCGRLYRGQRVDWWLLEAKIYRDLPDGREPADELRVRGRAACGIGQAIARKFGLPFEQAMAIAQHYSGEKELGVRTWMMDFTRDPWVALFFASDDGKTGDVGVVWDILTREYDGFTAGAGNPLGPLQLVVPPGVPRIGNQAGVFAVATHPRIMAQYLPFGIETRFRQATGLVFEDPVLGIIRDTIYPPDDPYPGKLREFQDAVTACSCGSELRCRIPVSLVPDIADARIYEAALTSWLVSKWSAELEPPELPGVRMLLPRLAAYHGLLQSARYVQRLPRLGARSLTRLKMAFSHLCMAVHERRAPSLHDAIMRAYVEHWANIGGRGESVVLVEAMVEVGIVAEE